MSSSHTTLFAVAFFSMIFILYMFVTSPIESVTTSPVTRVNEERVAEKTIPVEVKAKTFQVEKTYAHLQVTLCRENPSKYEGNRNHSNSCPQDGIVTVAQGGRLGNQIWEYASVWAAARETILKPYVPKCIKDTLSALFENLTVPTLDEIAHCPITNVQFKQLQPLQDWRNAEDNVILAKYSTYPSRVLKYIEDFPKEFAIKKDLVRQSQDELRSAMETTLTSNEGVVFVGIHIRRTDYLNFIKSKYDENPPSPDFYERAMKTFESKFNNVLFVMISDDPLWCKGTFGKKTNLYVTGLEKKNSAELDLAIMSSCNCSIFDYGTYGAWGAVMARGETIYYNLSNNFNNEIAGMLNNWYTI